MILKIGLIIVLIFLSMISFLFLLSMVIPINIELGKPNNKFFHLKIKSGKPD